MIPLKKIRICHFSSVHKTSDSRVFDRECKSLSNYFEVYFIGIGNTTETKEGVNIIGIKQSKKPFFRLFQTSFLSFYKAVQLDASVYHIHDAELLWAGILLSLSGKQVIYDIHENTACDIYYRKWLPRGLKSILVAVYKWFMLLAKNYIHFVPVIANPNDIEKLFIQKQEEFTIVQNYAELSLFKQYRNISRKNHPIWHLLYVGRLRDYYYNIDPVLEAIYLLKKEGIVVHFDLIGLIEPQFLQGFEHLSFWKEIQQQVTFYGELTRSEWLEKSKEASIGICIKNQAEGEVLSHERKLFEYMALGLPSIFCNKKIYTDFNSKHQIGVAVDIENPIAIQLAIQQLIADKILYEQLAKNCLLASEQAINWEQEFDKLLHLYQALVNKAS